MLRLNDIKDLDWDVLAYLMSAPGKRLRRREIRNALVKKYKYEEESFDVILQRSLDRLLRSGLLKKHSKAHQLVYYYIPKSRQKEIGDEQQRRFAHRKFDEIWDQLTSEQRKKTVENLVQQTGLLLQSEKTFVKNLTTSFKDLMTQWISELEEPSESVRNKYSAEQRREFLEQFRSLKEEWMRLETDIANEDNYWKERYGEMINLGMEFAKKVVEPCYNGRFNEAIEDLMRKAIEEQDKRK